MTRCMNIKKEYLQKMKWLAPLLCSCCLSCSTTTNWQDTSFYKFSDDLDMEAEDFDPSPLACVPSAQRMQLIHKNYPPETIDLDYAQLVNSYTMVDAKEFIIAQAQTADILMLNEAHHFPTHRRFARSLLKELWDADYRYFGLEALTYTDHFTQPSYPLNDLGYYCHEPTFALLLREAILLGFTLFPYEYTGPESGKIREQAQAENIAAFLENHTEGKTLIYCGYSHNFECELPDWEKAMAGRLANLVDDTILTVNQWFFNDISEIKSNKPVVLVDSLNQPFQYSDCNDIYVFHPAYDYSESRCNWKADENTEWKKVDFIPPSTHYPVLVFAYNNASEIKDGAPYDCIELTEPSQIEWLLLPKNEPYVIVVIDRFRKRVPLKL